MYKKKQINQSRPKAILKKQCFTIIKLTLSLTFSFVLSSPALLAKTSDTLTQIAQQRTQKIPYQAVTIEPVADLVGQPMSKTKPTMSAEQAYKEIPLELPFGKKKPNPFPLCPRVHQLLFNEQVTVVEEKNTEVCIAIANLFFSTSAQQKPHCTYWTLKKNILPISALTDEELKKIPEPISFAHKKISNKNTISLIYPVTDPITGKTYSAGTRFIYIPEKTTKKLYSAYAYDTKQQKIITIKLPRKYCMPKVGPEPQQKIEQFVALLKAWAHLKNSKIAYVWGGRSFTVKNIKPEMRQVINKNEEYTIPDHPTFPKSGIDCTSLVSTAAQLCEIPYFFKNSTTIHAQMRPLDAHEKLSPGDIILITKPNHVMIVSNLEKNLLIEARTCAHGYGRVHEIPLCEQFQHVQTYADLRKIYEEKLPVNRLNKLGNIIARAEGVRLFKLNSVWE